MNIDAAKKVAAEIGGAAFVCDVTKEESARKAIDEAAKAIGSPRILVNCAGILGAKRILGKEGPMGLDFFENVIRVNLAGTFNMLRLASEAMSKLEPLNKDGERGIVINTASVAAYEGQIGQAAYAASKGGIVGLTLPAARELGKFGIRVATIAPGLVKTPMVAGMPQEVQDSLAAAIPFPSRLVEPSEFARLVMHVIENTAINGETIRLDGALRLAAK
jgi:NAD(P)-dependent dehydrogenase (short-subunit alcohol dehydrogenase family)